MNNPRYRLYFVVLVVIISASIGASQSFAELSTLLPDSMFLQIALGRPPRPERPVEQVQVVTPVTGPPPVVSSVSPSFGPSNGNTTVVVNGANFLPNARVYFGLQQSQNATVNSGTQITAVTPPGPAGPVIVLVENPDTEQGGLSNAYVYQAVLAPTVSSVSPSSGFTTGGTAITVTGTNFQAGATIDIGGVAASSVVLVNSTTLTAQTPPQSPGAFPVKVTNPDAQANASGPNFTFNPVPAPGISSVSPSSGPTAGGTAVTINGSNFANGLVVTFGAVPAVVNTVTPTQITVSAPTHSPGVVNVVVTNPDAQAATKASAFNYIGVAAPLIGTISPNSAINKGGTVITINGSNFTAGTQVLFGATAAQAVVVDPSGTKLTVTTPATSTVGLVNVTVNSAGGSATQVNGFRFGQVLFQSGFEQLFQGWDVTVSPPALTITLDPTKVRTGAAAGQLYFNVCGDVTNPLCGASHQDDNRWFQKNFVDPGLKDVFIRGYFFLKTPEPGGTINVQRKLFYLKAKPAPGGTPAFLWAVVLTSEVGGGNVQPSIRINYNAQYSCPACVPAHAGIPGVGLRGSENELPDKPTLFNGVANLNFDQWYSIEMHVKSKSAPGALDSVIEIWIDGNLVFKKTAFSLPNVICASTSKSYTACPAFPGDDVFNYGLVDFEIGTQADRLNYAVINEYRYLDDVVIADAYIGP